MSGFHGQNREVGKEHRYPANRMKSIASDANVTQAVIQALNYGLGGGCGRTPPPPPTPATATALAPLPTIVNLRCGAWYVPPERRGGTAYFKSTDGHYGRWAFSFTRLNLHLLTSHCLQLEDGGPGGGGDNEQKKKKEGNSGGSSDNRMEKKKKEKKHHGFILVDATQQGKRFPDALSKTVPLWTEVLNRALMADDDNSTAQIKGEKTAEAAGDSSAGKEERFHSTHSSQNFASFVPRNEVLEMEKRIPEMAQQFIDKGCRALIGSQLQPQKQHQQSSPAVSAAKTAGGGDEQKAEQEEEESADDTVITHSPFRLAKPLRCFHLACNDDQAIQQAIAYHKEFFFSSSAEVGDSAAAAAAVDNNGTDDNEGGGPLQQTTPYLREDLPFTPVFCLSASGDRDKVRSRGGWAYVAGAGDDHQSWSKGLDDTMFWRHVNALTDSLATHSEIESLMDRIVAAGGGDVDLDDQNDDQGGDGNEDAGAGSSKKGIKHRTRVQTVATTSMMAPTTTTEEDQEGCLHMHQAQEGGARDAARTSPPVAIGPRVAQGGLPLLLIPTSWLCFEQWFQDQVAKSSKKKNTTTTTTKTQGDEEESQPGVSFDLFILQLENVPTPDPSVSQTFVNNSAGVGLHYFSIDENAKFGLERSLNPVLTAARKAYRSCSNTKEEKDNKKMQPRAIVILSGDVSVTAVVAVAMTALFAGDAPQHKQAAGSGAAGGADPFTLNFHQAKALEKDDESSKNDHDHQQQLEEQQEEQEDDVGLSKKATNGHLMAQAKPQWLRHLLFPPPPAFTPAPSPPATPNPPVVSKAKIQWAQRFVVNQLSSGVFPSRAHMKQLSRYFLTPDRGGNAAAKGE